MGNPRPFGLQDMPCTHPENLPVTTPSAHSKELRGGGFQAHHGAGADRLSFHDRPVLQDKLNQNAKIESLRAVWPEYRSCWLRSAFTG